MRPCRPRTHESLTPLDRDHSHTIAIRRLLLGGLFVIDTGSQSGSSTSFAAATLELSRPRCSEDRLR
jgi:hypothetical protein